MNYYMHVYVLLFSRFNKSIIVVPMAVELTDPFRHEGIEQWRATWHPRGIQFHGKPDELSPGLEIADGLQATAFKLIIHELIAQLMSPPIEQVRAEHQTCAPTCPAEGPHDADNASRWGWVKRNTATKQRLEPRHRTITYAEVYFLMRSDDALSHETYPFFSQGMISFVWWKI